eukprot:m.53089 g.53089  ORF g.53089 m.53089 type:complete len:259 (-) comp11353_c0_seq3:91-867(-)
MHDWLFQHSEIALTLESDNVGLVHQLPLLDATRTKFASVVEQVYFATQHMFVYVFADFINTPCVNGMSVAFPRTLLDDFGGIAVLEHHMAEDFALSKLIQASGKRTKLLPTPVLQVGTASTFKAIITRHIRWLHLRRASLKNLALLEPTTEIVPMAVLIASIGWTPFSMSMTWFLALIVIIHITTAFYALTLTSKFDVHMWPAFIQAYLARELLYPLFYIHAMRTNEIQWQGRVYKHTHQTFARQRTRLLTTSGADFD